MTKINLRHIYHQLANNKKKGAVASFPKYTYAHLHPQCNCPGLTSCVKEKRQNVATKWLVMKRVLKTNQGKTNTNISVSKVAVDQDDLLTQ